MLAEQTLFKCTIFLGHEKIAGHYLFHYTWTIYRPFWTYVAEKKGARISLYFSSITATLQSPFGVNDNSFDYYPFTWPEYRLVTKS